MIRSRFNRGKLKLLRGIKSSMKTRIKSTTVEGKTVYFVEVKRNGRWNPLRSFGAVKQFNHPQHIENYLNKTKR